MSSLSPIQLLEAEELYYKKKAADVRTARRALEAAVPSHVPVQPVIQEAAEAVHVMRQIPVISLCGADEWKAELPKCFHQPVSKIDDVKTGFTGSMGECYGITESWDAVLGSATTTAQRISIIKGKKYTYAEGHGDRSGKPLHLNSIKNGIVPFYEFSQQEDPYFAIKKGGTAYWLAKKTSGYSFTPGCRYPHRISFEIVRRLTEEEGDLKSVPGIPQQTVRYKTLAVPPPRILS